MEFSFEVNPDLDIAIGSEVNFEESESEFELEDFTALGINPLSPTEAKPGSEEKVRMLAARYSAGVPLWHDSDCYDHGPASLNVDGEDDELINEDEVEEVDF
ncbi:hypothetical protein Mal4_08550 [Maioricimonas rarisocia]|uniref:Uncharacterized protein n=1 Tax=Maioricimonas rarisocia TaxID=2528026 RepID=A0A517Z276_9PLAN|nr:hypothetical protein [Maioricimonas rarisocia]QDU36568.1 hypothetical protein Mal4_08550 [Maioricimonas rarisocia]